MKKILSMIISLVLLLGCAATLGEEAEAKVPLGTVSINGAFTLQCGIPEGYTPIPLMATSDQIIAGLRPDDPEKPTMMLSVAFDETYANVGRMNELDAEALDLLEQTYLQDDPTIEFSYGETGYGTLLLIAKQTQTEPNYIDFLSIYKGYFVEFVMMPSQGAKSRTLTDDQMSTAVDFLTNLDFIEADEGAVRAQAEANTDYYTADIHSYDAENHSLNLTLKVPLRLEKSYVENALENKAIKLDEEIEIETVKQEGDEIEINETYYLTKQEDGSYTAHHVENDVPVLVVWATDYTSVLATDAVFTDHINPETLDPLDEPTEHTIEEFIEMLQTEGTTAVGPGFDCDNVNVAIDEHNQVTKIDRFYTPWQ